MNKNFLSILTAAAIIIGMSASGSEAMDPTSCEACFKAAEKEYPEPTLDGTFDSENFDTAISKYLTNLCKFLAKESICTTHDCHLVAGCPEDTMTKKP